MRGDTTSMLESLSKVYPFRGCPSLTPFFFRPCTNCPNCRKHLFDTLMPYCASMKGHGMTWNDMK